MDLKRVFIASMIHAGAQTDLRKLSQITAYFYPPAAQNPAVRSVRYRVLSTEDGIRSHSITDLACALYAKANPPLDNAAMRRGESPLYQLAKWRTASWLGA